MQMQLERHTSRFLKSASSSSLRQQNRSRCVYIKWTIYPTGLWARDIRMPPLKRVKLKQGYSKTMKRAFCVSLWIRGTLRTIPRSYALPISSACEADAVAVSRHKGPYISLLLLDESEPRKLAGEERNAILQHREIRLAGFRRWVLHMQKRTEGKRHRVFALRQRRTADGSAPRRRGTGARPRGLPRRGRAQVLRKGGTAPALELSAPGPKIDAPASCERASRIAPTETTKRPRCHFTTRPRARSSSSGRIPSIRRRRETRYMTLDMAIQRDGQ